MISLNDTSVGNFISDNGARLSFSLVNDFFKPSSVGIKVFTPSHALDAILVTPVVKESNLSPIALNPSEKVSCDTKPNVRAFKAPAAPSLTADPSLPVFLYSSIPAVTPPIIPIPAVTAIPSGPANLAAPPSILSKPPPAFARPPTLLAAPPAIFPFPVLKIEFNAPLIEFAPLLAIPSKPDPFFIPRSNSFLPFPFVAPHTDLNELPILLLAFDAILFNPVFASLNGFLRANPTPFVTIPKDPKTANLIAPNAARAIVPKPKVFNAIRPRNTASAPLWSLKKFFNLSQLKSVIKLPKSVKKGTSFLVINPAALAIILINLSHNGLLTNANNASISPAKRVPFKISPNFLPPFLAASFIEPAIPPIPPAIFFNKFLVFFSPLS